MTVVPVHPMSDSQVCPLITAMSGQTVRHISSRSKHLGQPDPQEHGLHVIMTVEDSVMCSRSFGQLAIVQQHRNTGVPILKGEDVDRHRHGPPTSRPVCRITVGSALPLNSRACKRNVPGFRLPRSVALFFSRTHLQSRSYRWHSADRGDDAASRSCTALPRLLSFPLGASF